MQQLPIRPESPWLAPLAGWSDLSFRLLCREQGAAVCCTEMVSAKGLVYGGRNTEDLLATTVPGGDVLGDGTAADDSPLVVQIFGAEAEFLSEAVARLRERGFRWFDVNMGCSVPKVTKTGSGAAMMRDVSAALRAAEAVVAAAGEGMCGFKMRLGWDSGHETWRELAAGLEKLGAGWITMHPRHAVQGFSGTPRFSAIGELASLLRIPVIASGDLFTAGDGVRVLRETGAACVMYARGALRNPAVFRRHIELLAGGELSDEASVVSPPFDGRPLQAQNACDVLDGLPADRESLRRIISRHAVLARRYSPELALLKMRTFVPRYVKSLDGAKALRQKIVTCRTWEELDAVTTEFFDD